MRHELILMLVTEKVTDGFSMNYNRSLRQARHEFFNNNYYRGHSLLPTHI